MRFFFFSVKVVYQHFTPPATPNDHLTPDGKGLCSSIPLSRWPRSTCVIPILQGWPMVSGHGSGQQRSTNKRKKTAATLSPGVVSDTCTYYTHCQHTFSRVRGRCSHEKKKVLDETFALEESKRLELEYLAREKKEAERRLQLEHEATKVRASRPTRGGKGNVLRAVARVGSCFRRGNVRGGIGFALAFFIRTYKRTYTWYSQRTFTS